MHWFLLPLAGSLAIALYLAWADYRLAEAARQMAVVISREFSGAKRLWFQGHWGFQYYMEKLGAKPLNRQNLQLLSGDTVAVPLGNSFLFPLPAEQVSLVRTYESLPTKWVALMNHAVGAGYYSDGWGPLPFVFGPAVSEKYLVFQTR